MVTISQIAQHFGVSIAAVSKALNGLPGVSESLRQQIIAYAEENNYVPNLYGRGLKGKRFKTIGVIIPDITNLTYSELIKGIESTAEAFEYNIILCNSYDDYRLELREIRMLIEKRVDGLIIVPAYVSDDECQNRYDKVEKLEIPYVCVSRKIEGSSCDYVGNDAMQGAYLQTRHLIECGHEKIVHITKGKKLSSVIEHIDGVQKAMRENNLPDAPVYGIDDTDVEFSLKQLTDLFDRVEEFTAVVAFTDRMAIQIIRALKMIGKKVPEDVAVVGFNDDDYAKLYSLSTVTQDSVAMGKAAFELLIDRIENKTIPYRTFFVISPHLVKRDST